jgi:hypothetical protein
MGFVGMESSLEEAALELLEDSITDMSTVLLQSEVPS